MKVDKNSVWTIETYALHNESMREVEIKLQEVKVQHLEAVVALNDRRYTEGNELRAMALKIKETADRDALELDRASQAYKAERYDVRSEQSLKETGIYATRDDLATVFSKSEKSLLSFIEEMKLALKPMVDHIAADKGANASQTKQIAFLFLLFTAATFIINYLMK